MTTGGGGDGEALVDWVIRAYEYDALLPYPALIVLGPFMPPERQAEFMRRVADLKRVEAITFDTHLEVLLANATGVVAMGGYNTFCEILSLDKRALVVPRTAPRLEQYIRASHGVAWRGCRSSVRRWSATESMYRAYRERLERMRVCLFGLNSASATTSS